MVAVASAGPCKSFAPRFRQITTPAPHLFADTRIENTHFTICVFLRGDILADRQRPRSIVMSMSVCVSVCPRGYLRDHTRDLYQIFVLVAYVRGSVLLRHVDDRPHRLSAGRGQRECTTRTKCNPLLPSLKPNSITPAGSELAPNMFRASSCQIPLH